MQLDISRADNIYRFRLEQPEAGTAVRQSTSPPISKANQRSLRQAIEQATRGSYGSFTLEDLGRLMCSLLVPQDIQDFLRNLDAPLLISTDTPQMPWELLYDDTCQQFLGVRCSVARRLVTDLEVARPNATREFAEERSFLLVANPRGDLSGAEREVEQLHDLITDRQADARILMGSRATLLPVQLELQNGEHYAAIHYAGHAELDAPSRQNALLLAERTRLTAAAIRKLMRGRPCVFLNACGTDQPSEAGRRAALGWQVAEGLASAFIHGGARAVIGTRWEVDDQGAREFALLFYEAALQGMPIGGALRQARLRFREQRPGDATWAAFVLYGDPLAPLIAPLDLFLYDGRLNRSRFAPEVNAALDLLPREAQRLGYDFVATPHLFIALTKVADGCTQAMLQRLGFSPKPVRDQLRRDVRKGREVTQPPGLLRSSFSAHALHILEAADQNAGAEGAERIGERHVLLGFLQAAEGVVVESLHRQGIDLDRLRAALQGAPPPQADGPAVAAPLAPEGDTTPLGSLADTKLSPQAVQVFAFALREAHRSGYRLIETPHLIIGLAKIRDGCLARALQQQGFDPKRLRDALRFALQPAGAPIEEPAAERTRDAIASAVLSPKVQSIVRRAAGEAGAAQSESIQERHLLIAFLKRDDSATARLLESLGVDLAGLLHSILGDAAGAPAASTPLLDRLGRDLTREAREGKLKPVIGRRHEMQRIAQVLARTDKNTPLLIGDAGVGKTAIIEGLAQTIADGNVPEHLRGKRIVELPVAHLVAGTKYRGELEERLAQVIREAGQPDVILFLDEIHTLAGAGRAEGGMLDVGNILKPALARGEIRCIGATTPAEFRNSIEKDAALERRFQPILIEEPSANETLDILRQTRQRYETHHHVRLPDATLEAAVNFAVAYLPERRLPDKACDLVDEACARVRVKSVSQWAAREPAQPIEPPAVEPELVAEVVAEWTGIPVTRLTADEQAELLRLEDVLRRRIIGQDEAVVAVAQAVRLGRAGLKKPNRPVGAFLFIGPSGVGKTELAKALAEALFGSEQDLIRFDMSEYAEASSVARLIGAPPGYVGYEDEGLLTGALRRKPNGVVLLDEIEKAHSRVYDLLLSLLDEGRLTDAQGRLADGRNAIFIMTCNVGTAFIENKQAMGFRARDATIEDARHDVMNELRQTFRPEFLNRLDGVILFHALGPNHLRAIAGLQIDALAAQVKAQHGITLRVADDALDLLCTEGTSKTLNARPLQRAIEQRVAVPLSRLILEGVKGTIAVRVVDGQIDLVATI
ncbi:MAG TPA: AAA family ATPase [Anaerolineae bacterium]